MRRRDNWGGDGNGEFIASSRRLFHVQGSLTTRPCTEGMRWIVMTEPLTLSTEQVVAYVDRFGKTARPVQPTNGRKVEHYVD